MATYRLGVLYGDGIGPEIVQATVDLAEAAARKHGGVDFDWVYLPMGWDGLNQYHSSMPEVTKRELERCQGWITGPHDSISYPVAERAERNPSGELRHHFDLYANIRPAKSYSTINGLLKNADLVIVRENTEEFYSDRNMYQGVGEMMPTPDMALAMGVFTRRAAERVAHVALRLAQARRKKVSIVHKANVITLGMSLFRDSCKAVARAYPDVTVDDYLVDAMAAHLVRHAEDFDVIVTTNMCGDILSDMTAELVGSLGLAPSLNVGDGRAMAQAAHGSAPDIAGQGVANPVGEMLSAAMLARWLGEQHHDAAIEALGDMLENGILATWAAGIRTRDLGGDASTKAFTEAVIQHL